MGYIPDVASGSAPHLTDSLAKKILGGTQAPINPHSQRLLAASLKPTKPQMTGARGKPKVKKASRRLSRKARRRPVPRVPALKRTRKRPQPRPTTHGARRRSADTTARPRGSSWTSLGPKSRALLLFSLSMCSQLFFRECDCLYVASCFHLDLQFELV